MPSLPNCQVQLYKDRPDIREVSEFGNYKAFTAIIPIYILHELQEVDCNGGEENTSANTSIDDSCTVNFDQD